MKIFLLLLIIFGIWSAWLNFKPELSFWLFCKDVLKKDYRLFDGFGFWLFCGLGGSGKTISMVEYLDRMKFRYPDVKIYCNFAYDGADGLIEGWEDILQLENYTLKLVDYETYEKLNDYNRFSRGARCYEKIHQGIIFGFDEIHLTFQSTKWESAPDNMLEYISQQRKLHKQIVATSQVFTRVDKKLREQTNFVIECSSMFWGRWTFNKYFHTAEYLANDEKFDAGNKKRKKVKRYSFVATDYIRSRYDTYQVMVNLNQPKSDSLIEKSRLQRLISDSIS